MSYMEERMDHQIEAGIRMKEDLDMRIMLAEAMGWTHIRMKWIAMDETSYPFGCPPANQYSGGVVQKQYKEQIPDPFTDANDDYTVLEWMRDWRAQGITQEQLHAFNARVGDHWSFTAASPSSSWIQYQVGDYARAAISVLTRRETE